MNPLIYKRGEIYLARLDPAVGSEQGGTRPVLIVQNNTGNRFSPTTIAAAFTSREKTDLPTHLYVGRQFGLNKKSLLMTEQIRTLDKSRLILRIGELDPFTMREVNHKLITSLDLAGRESFKIILCPECAKLFYSAPRFFARRENPYPEGDDTCQFCGRKKGIGYEIIITGD